VKELNRQESLLGKMTVLPSLLLLQAALAAATCK